MSKLISLPSDPNQSYWIGEINQKKKKRNLLPRQLIISTIIRVYVHGLKKRLFCLF